MKLSKNQLEAIQHTDGPALAIAVPGAGKTTVIIHRTFNLIKNHGVDPRKILTITFSRASSKDMKSRFDSVFPGYPHVHFSTIHSFAFQIIRDYAMKTRVKYTLLESRKSEVSKYRLLSDLYFKHNKKYIQEDELENLINKISYSKNMLLSNDEIENKYGPENINFLNIFQDYENYKIMNNYIDFDDMLTFSLDILKSQADILKKYKELYQYIQVDEAQDTSRAQIEIIKLLAYPNNNLFVVADDDQSIYGFRGAYPDELFCFKEIYKNSKFFPMEENYRSTRDIVDLTSSFIKNNKKRYDKKIYTRNQTIPKSTKIVEVSSMKEQYDFLLKDILNHGDYENTAILFRNNQSSLGLMDLLSKEAIAINNQAKKSNLFKNNFILRDLDNFFELAKHRNSLNNFKAIYYKMKGYTSKKQLDYISSRNYDLSVFQRLLSFPNLPSYYIENFNELEEDFDRLEKADFNKALNIIEHDLGYLDYLREHEDRLGGSYSRSKNTLSLIKILGQGLEDIDDFYEKLSFLNKIDNQEEGVTLTTMHSSKGLEFNRVYIVDLIGGEFPSGKLKKNNLEDLDSYEEERRLFYVAMTRARHELTIISPKSENTGSFSQSDFVKELININKN